MNKVIPIDIYNIDMLFVVGEKEELKSSLEEHLSNDDANKAYNERILTKEVLDGQPYLVVVRLLYGFLMQMTKGHWHMRYSIVCAS